MAHRKMVPSSVRASGIGRFYVVAMILLAVAGCSHRRAAMRPVFTTPIPSATAPAIVVPAEPGGIVTPETETQTEPEPYLTPNAMVPAPINSEPVIRTRNSPPVPNEADEPPLNQPSQDGSVPSSSSSGGVELTKPSALRSTGRKASAPRRTPRVSYREEVRPFLNEPFDLFQPPKADRPWKYIVLHHSANPKGGYDQIDRDHRKVLGFEGCGYHFVIGNGTDSPDGQIEVADRWLNQKNGVHCRNGRTPEVNEYGIGICLVGNLDQSPPTPRQIAAARSLVAYLTDRYQIPADHAGSHDQFADSPTACPGQYFPSEAIFGSKHLAVR